MRCLECNNLVIKSIDYKNIFKDNMYKICETCFIEKNFIQALMIIPVKNGIIYMNQLFEEDCNPLSVMNFAKPYYEYYLYNINHFNTIILFYDTFTKKDYEILKNIDLGNYYIIANNSKIKENDYEN